MLSKDEARSLAYRRLREAGAGRFPFPHEGRIPNFRGAEAAAERLRALTVYRQARAVKVNPDAAQLPVRAMVLRDGKVLYMPSPRLRGAFVRIRPQDVPAGDIEKAVTIRYCRRYGSEVPLVPGRSFEDVDLVVVGSVAVGRRGARAGKGEGYSDLEYAILRELGHAPVAVATTVHPAQLVGEFPLEPHDLPVDYIVTPDEVIETATPHPKPTGVDWSRLRDEAVAAMPVLRELRKLRWESLTVPDVIGPGLAVLFVGLNPGRWSAIRGHHFAGPGNHFWKLLHQAGFTPHLLAPEREGELFRYGIGITNVVARASRGEGDHGVVAGSPGLPQGLFGMGQSDLGPAEFMHPYSGCTGVPEGCERHRGAVVPARPGPAGAHERAAHPPQDETPAPGASCRSHRAQGPSPLSSHERIHSCISGGSGGRGAGPVARTHRAFSRL